MFKVLLSILIVPLLYLTRQQHQWLSIINRYFCYANKCNKLAELFNFCHLGIDFHYLSTCIFKVKFLCMFVSKLLHFSI